MKIQELCDILNTISPFELQAKWDNSGLNVGNMQADCRQIYTALELDLQIAHNLLPHSALIVHHPLIFQPLRTLSTDCYPSNLIALCLQKDIHVIAMHTNFDVTHLNKTFAKKLNLESLGFSHIGEEEYSLMYKKDSLMPTHNLAQHIKDSMGLSTLRYTQKDSLIQTLYITCGSNASAYKIAEKGSCIITGDIKYHDAMIAASNGISFIDVPHFESECIFADLMAKALQTHNIEAIISSLENPFCYI